MSKMKKLILSLVLFSLAGCSANSSPERHARHFVFNQTEMLSGTMHNNRNAAYAANLPQFKKLYDMGKADKQKGVSQDQALAYADMIRKQAEQPQSTQATNTNNKNDKWTEDINAKDARLWHNQLADTYLDGYKGIQ